MWQSTRFSEKLVTLPAATAVKATECPERITQGVSQSFLLPFLSFALDFCVIDF
jgi:hypothetical protein